jgi:hypothetical protein
MRCARQEADRGYFVRLETLDELRSRKITLVKRRAARLTTD